MWGVPSTKERTDGRNVFGQDRGTDRRGRRRAVPFAFGRRRRLVTVHRQRSLRAGRADPVAVAVRPSVHPSTVQFTTRDAPCITRTLSCVVVVVSSDRAIYLCDRRKQNETTFPGGCEHGNAVKRDAARTVEASVRSVTCFSSLLLLVHRVSFTDVVNPPP